MRRKNILLVVMLLFMFNSITVFGREMTEQVIYNDSHMSEDDEDDMGSDMNQDISQFNADNVFGNKLDATDTTDLDANEGNENNNEVDNNSDTDNNKIEEKHYGWYFNEKHSGWYYYNQQGNKLFGWQYISGKWYYLDAENQEYPGLMLADCGKKIGGATYFFDKSGVMLTGWVFRPEGWYYTDKSGAMLEGWQRVGNKWYYLDESNQDYPGIMLANCERVIGNETYYFALSGAMRAGWYAESGSWYYYDDYTGQIVSGWRKVGNAWYYMDPENHNKMIANGWKKIGSQWYLFNANGSMRTNWVWTNGLWYYLGSDGAARTGWKVIGGNWYYFYTANDPHGGVECAMARNVSIDGWKLTDSGAMVSSTEMKMLAKAQSYASNTKYLILVDRSACRVGIYTGKAGNWKQSKFWSCSPGKPSTPTVSGTFTVQGKGYYFDSGRARCFYYTQFKGNYLFHSVLYAQTSRPSKIIDGRLGMQLSHGCVRLDVNNAKWIYDNVPRGTKVVIY